MNKYGVLKGIAALSLFVTAATAAAVAKPRAVNDSPADETECPLNEGDDCMWVPAESFCFKTYVHHKSYDDAMETCMTMGTDECPSRLLAVENVPEFLDNKEDGTPDMLWVEGVLNESNQYETMEGSLITFPGLPYSPDASNPFLPGSEYVCLQVSTSKIFGVGTDVDKWSFICQSCISL